MMLEPHLIDWKTADDSMVYYAACDGVPEAIQEQQRRELAARTEPNQKPDQQA